jgi:hypothetical protein
MNVDLAVTCDYAIIDRFSKLSVLGIFSHIWVARLPAVHPRLHLVLHLKGRRTEIGEHRVRIRLLDDDGTEIIAGDGTVTFAEPPAGVLDISAGCVLVFDVPFQKAGKCHFEISVDGEVKTEIPITVAVGPSSPVPGAGGVN